MKTSTKFLLVIVALLASASALNAQEVGQMVNTAEQSVLVVDNDNQDTPSVAGLSVDNLRIRRGQKIADAGKTLMIGGGAIALSSTVFFALAHAQWDRTNNPEAPDDMPVYPIFALAGYTVGAAFALVGLPVFFAGKDIVVKNGGKMVTVGDSCESGSAALIDVGLGIPPFVSLDAVYGYNFNPNLFVGAGVGGKMWLMSSLGRGENTAAIPVYAQVRYSLGKGRISPYAAISGGYDMISATPYFGFDFGARIRSTRNKISIFGDEIERDNSWWLSSKLGYTNNEELFLSIGVAKSF